MSSLVFGKYMPVNSFMHRLDPRAKIIAMFVMIIAIFLPHSWLVYAFLGIVIFKINHVYDAFSFDY